MKKAFDQTVRDLKREVNKKVLKIPGIEQKILDATSNEPWGPHGSLLADIAQATRNYHEYQMIMTVIWKRINDTGRNWRHVHKGLTVLEYLVAHGSERLIDEIKEHIYQISTLSDFQYIDSSGKDQGNNVRRKSQSLVALVNNKERIQEVRQKALSNKDKYHSTFSTGGINRPSSYSSTGGGYGDQYDDDHYEGRYGSRDDDQNGHGREREGGYRDGDRYGSSGDSYNRDGDRYSRDSDERYNRDSYRDDDYRGGQGHDGYRFGPRNKSTDGDRDRSLEDDDRYLSRSAGGRGDEPSHDERRLERKHSEQIIGAPPSYEEAIRDDQDHIHEDRDVGTVPLPKESSSPAPKISSPSESPSQGQNPVVANTAVLPSSKGGDSFEQFDPRGSAKAAAPITSSPGMDLFGSLSDADSINALALMPVSTTSEADIPSNSDFGTNFVALSLGSTVLNQPTGDPFGDAPFMAILQDNSTPAQPQNFTPTNPFHPSTGPIGFSEPPPPVTPNMDTVSAFDFGDSFYGISYTPSIVLNGQLPTATSEILPPEVPPTQPNTIVSENLLPQTTAMCLQVPQPANFQPATSAGAQSAPPNILSQSGLPASQAPPSYLPSELGMTAPLASHVAQQHLSQPGLSGPPVLQAVPQHFPQPGLSAPLVSQALPTNLLSAPIASQAAAAATNGQPAKASQVKDKFETKSTVWSDTLSRGLVNLNISGPKINPLADIGIDFDSINRMEKRKEKEKSSATPVSTITMGKAMGSGTGIGRAGASGLAPPPNPIMGSGMGMGMGVGMSNSGGMGMGMGMGMNNTGGMGMGMGMMSMGAYGGGMNQPTGTGTGMNMGMGMGMVAPIRPPTGMPPGPGVPGTGYNPMMGMGGYGSQQQYGQQQYGGGYR